MFTRTLRRALLDPRYQVPPTFLLPWTAGFTTVSAATEAINLPPQQPSNSPPVAPRQSESDGVENKVTFPAPHSSSPSTPSSNATPPTLSDSTRELLPLLRAQGPHYITAHIYDKAYLLTQGDTLRLPFLMKDVEPGDIIRLNRAVNLGSRDFTLKPGAVPPKLKSPTRASTTFVDPTTGNLSSRSVGVPIASGALPSENIVAAPHFVPHIAKGKFSYLDDRLFVCRALVMGVESEPLRVMEKTKRRQRHVKHVKSKHRSTILKIKELRVRSLEEIDEGKLD